MSTTEVVAPPAPSALLAGRDAASKEREDRLEIARKKLKKFRARQLSKTSSIGSSVSSVASTSQRHSTQSAAERPVSIHRHRKSSSKNSLSGFNPSNSISQGHGRRISHSRKGSRGGSFGGGGHGHSRSRASISISKPAPPPIERVAPIETILVFEESLTPIPAATPVFAPLPATAPPPTTASPRVAGLGAPPSWNATGAGCFPNSPDLRHSPPTPTAAGKQAFSHLPHASSPSLSSTSLHGRRASRHGRRSSVANFRESLDLVSGGLEPSTIGVPGALLQPGTSSFAPANADGSSPPSPAFSSRSVSPNGSGRPGADMSDPARVLEALKERGRRESDADEDPERLRVAALEALEGRVCAPSPIIDLGTSAEGELLVAPSSPGFIGAPIQPPVSPNAQLFSSPMIGLGLGGKRNSWSAPGPVTAAGARGAMDLGMLVEEEEEEYGDDESEGVKSVTSSPRKRGTGSPRKRPASLFLSRSPSVDSVAVSVIASPVDEGSNLTSSHSFAARPMRLSLSLSSSAASSLANTPSTNSAATTSPGPRAPTLRALSLPASAPLIRTGSDEGSSGEKRQHSLFHSIAVESANGNMMVRSGSHSPTPPASAPSTNRGLRSLSMVSQAAASPVTPPSRSERTFTAPPASTSFLPTATAIERPKPPTPAKRSSISYRNTSISSSITPSPDGPMAAASKATRRSFRPLSISAQSPAFPFAPFDGSFGGLEVEMTDEEDEEDGDRTPTSEDPQVLLLQVASLRSKIEQMKSQSAHMASTHALEVAEFEKKAGEEAREMRMRNSELERSLEEAKVGRRFEVEGLGREVEQAKEAINDLTDERDSLREDVEGWRTRCLSLQKVVKKQQEDEAMASAQAKLIGEMRDQIYNLVAALERERGEHAETRNEVERLMNQRPLSPIEDDAFEDDEEAAIGGRPDMMTGSRHGFQSASDGSVLSSFGRSYSGNTTEDTSMTTDLEDSFSGKMMSSPPSGHSSFGQAIGFPAGSRRDSDFGPAHTGPALHTLTEEEEEEEASRAEAASEGERVRLDSGSTGSTGTSENMPPTPSKDVLPPGHGRSDSFVRHWSFPKGSVSSLRASTDEFHSFFDLNRHTSLPALPINESILPPFLHADLSIDEDEVDTYEPQFAHTHTRRPSSPRPMEKMAPHTRRFSGQYATKAPPVAPSAFVHAAMAAQPIPKAAVAPVVPVARGFGRFGSLLGSLGGWSPYAAVAAPAPTPAAPAPPAPTNHHLSISTTIEVDEQDEQHVFLSSTRHQTPASLLHSSRGPKTYIKATQQPIPRASRLGLLDFTPTCCSHEAVLFA